MGTIYVYWKSRYGHAVDLKTGNASDPADECEDDAYRFPQNTEEAAVEAAKSIAKVTGDDVYAGTFKERLREAILEVVDEESKEDWECGALGEVVDEAYHYYFQGDEDPSYQNFICNVSGDMHETNRIFKAVRSVFNTH